MHDGRVHAFHGFTFRIRIFMHGSPVLDTQFYIILPSKWHVSATWYSAQHRTSALPKAKPLALNGGKCYLDPVCITNMRVEFRDPST
jgi:hypothetical protein